MPPSFDLGKFLQALEILVSRFERVQRRSPGKSSGSIAAGLLACNKGASYLDCGIILALRGGPLGSFARQTRRPTFANC
jgi:hypothetical protein